MDAAITARDLWPLLLKLPHDEQLRLAKLALFAASNGGRADPEAYQLVPVTAREFCVADDPLEWEGAGWEEY